MKKISGITEAFRKIILFLIFLLFSCTKKKEILIIFHAGSLAKPMAQLAEMFSRKNPNLKVIREAAGSRLTARKVSELNRIADIVAVSDFSVIEDLLMPEYADWYINFAHNQMVIAFTEKSKYASEINSENWYKILTRKDVKFGRSDENLDPCGYRTLMVWQLADLYYKDKINGKGIYQALQERCPPENIRPSEIELLPLLQSLSLDYAFEYISIAKQHHLKFIKLPPQIDLSDPSLSEFYKKAKIKITGKKRGEFTTVIGKPIVYAITIPKVSSNPKCAIRFLKFLLSKEGAEIMRSNWQEPIIPAIASNRTKIPKELLNYLR